MSKAKELAVFEAEKYPVLGGAEGVAAIEAMRVNLLPGESLTETDFLRIKVPTQGATKWNVSENYVDEIVGICCLYAARGVVWPVMGEAKEGTIPVLRSGDLLTAHQVGEDWGDINPAALAGCLLSDASGRYDWKKLTGDGGPLGWGTGRNGAGKRATEYRVLGVLREGDVLPIVVSCPPGSIKNVSGFVKRLNVPYYRAVIGLRLESTKNSGGTSYSRIVPRLVDVLTPEQGETIRANYTARLAAVTVDEAADE